MIQGSRRAAGAATAFALPLPAAVLSASVCAGTVRELLAAVAAGVARSLLAAAPAAPLSAGLSLRAAPLGPRALSAGLLVGSMPAAVLPAAVPLRAGLLVP